MDAINKNFPVGQPDANGNYEWMRVRAGGGISSTGDVEIRDGDLDMNGGMIRNAVFDPPLNIAGEAFFTTPPLVLTHAIAPPFELFQADGTVPAPAITTAAPFDAVYCQPVVIPPAIKPYAEPVQITTGGPYGTTAKIGIYESGTYQVTIQLPVSVDVSNLPGGSQLNALGWFKLECRKNGTESVGEALITTKEMKKVGVSGPLGDPTCPAIYQEDLICTKNIFTVVNADLDYLGQGYCELDFTIYTGLANGPTSGTIDFKLQYTGASNSRENYYVELRKLS